MSDAISFNIKGVKCDNLACGWSDMNIKFDPDKYLNAPCPQCGSNLFTKADYVTMMRMFKAARIINLVVRPFQKFFEPKSHRMRWHVKMDGSGIPKIIKAKK